MQWDTRSVVLFIGYGSIDNSTIFSLYLEIDYILVMIIIVIGLNYAKDEHGEIQLISLGLNLL